MDRYVIDLEGSGRQFKQFLRNSGVDDTRFYDNGMGSVTTDLRYIFMETYNQITLALSADMRSTMIAIQNGPSVACFGHIPMMSNSQFVKAYSDAFKETALFLIGIMQRKVGFKLHLDYLLEQVTDDYAVVCVVEKQINQGM